MTITLVNPMNEAVAAPKPAAPRLGTLVGKTIGLLDISKPGGNIFLDRLEHLLLQRQAGKVVRICAAPCTSAASTVAPRYGR